MESVANFLTGPQIIFLGCYEVKKRVSHNKPNKVNPLY